MIINPLGLKNRFLLKIIPIIPIILAIALMLNLFLPLNLLQKILLFFILLIGYSIMFIQCYHLVRKKSYSIKKQQRQINPDFQVIKSAVNDELVSNSQESIIQEIPVYHSKAVTNEELIEQISKSKPQYIASTETKKYHKITCRFSKLIKKKFRVENNNEDFFKKNKFKPCKSCIKKKKSKLNI
jgi:hypothetical protein